MHPTFSVEVEDCIGMCEVYSDLAERQVVGIKSWFVVVRNDDIKHELM